MGEKFTINMTKEEMLRYYANKIVEDGIKSCSEFNTIVSLKDYNTNSIKLENYKNEILQLLYRDERISDVVIDDELNIDMVFYTDYCPFYYDDKPSIKYNEFLDSPTYQGVMLLDFIDYINKCINEKSCISIRKLIKDFTKSKKSINENKKVVSIFLEKSIIKTGFIEKYVYVDFKNYEELKSGLLKIVKQKDKEAEEKFEGKFE